MAKAKTTVTRERLIADINEIIAEAEELLKSAADDGSDQAKAFGTRVQERLASAKMRLDELEETLLETTRAATEKTRVVAQATDNYVHEHPWQTMGVVAGLGILLGLMLNRRD